MSSCRYLPGYLAVGFLIFLVSVSLTESVKVSGRRLRFLGGAITMDDEGDSDACVLDCEHSCSNSPSSWGTFACTCDLGYTLNEDQATCDDNDECALQMDDCEHACFNVEGGYVCSCNSGYTLNDDGATCDDDDECTSSTDDCDHICSNTAGGYSCSCISGYTLSGDGATCDDDDECALGADACEYACSNTEGGYVCSCNSGYTLNADGVSCDDNEECAMNTHDCEQSCINTDGGYTCTCSSGYTLNGDGSTCDDDDECALGTDSCEHSCANIDGSYACACNLGFTLNVDGVSCDEDDECAMGTAACEQTCSNTVGSYTCSCDPGFTLNGDGATCEDDDECAMGTAACEQTCSNTAGGFICSCDPGFALNADGATCDEDECAMGTDSCEHICSNTVGSYTCSCDPGFTLNGDGATCDDDDECAMGTDSCEQTCSNTAGGFTCSCDPGFTLNGDGATCDDEDECAMGTDSCEHICSNTAGSYTCSCDAGFTLNGDGATCDDTDQCFTGYFRRDALVIIGLAANSNLGRDVTPIGDLDGDGVFDMLVGAPGDYSGSGSITVALLRTEGSTKSETVISSGVNGKAALSGGDNFGFSVTQLGDVDGDGVTDVAVSAPYDDDGGTDVGAVYVLFMNTDGTVKGEQKISALSGGLQGPLYDYDLFGHAVAGIGDLNGDGVADMAVGAIYDDDGAQDSGAVYVLFLNPDGTVKAQQKIGSGIGGKAAFSGVVYFGGAVADVGDVDGDGVTDICVGSHGDGDGGTNAGAAYVLFMNTDGTVKGEQKISSSSGGLTGIDAEDFFGIGMDGLGDVNGDGVPDIVVSAFGDDDGATDTGAVYILFMNSDGTVNDQQKLSALYGGLINNQLDGNGLFGSSVANLGDLDSDGVVDLAIGAIGVSIGESNRGGVYVLFKVPTDSTTCQTDACVESDNGYSCSD